MSKIIIAVCDTDGVYAERLGEWISLEHRGELQAMSFCSPECFLENFSIHRPDIILLDQGFLEHVQVRGKRLITHRSTNRSTSEIIQ
ncbi:MAG: hypothetical protein HFI71_05255 [Lachnospiraceae bacterium]|nr:hypothetical protein [Lachnospiraceae bacterium]